MPEPTCFRSNSRSFLNFDVAFCLIRAQHLLDLASKKANEGGLNG